MRAVMDDGCRRLILPLLLFGWLSEMIDATRSAIGGYRRDRSKVLDDEEKQDMDELMWAAR